MSVNAHLGIEQSRRDDLEAIGYLLVYFMKGGRLPWMGLKVDGIRERYKEIGHKKEEMRTAELCYQIPREFGTYLRYIKTLKFTDTPDYNYLRNLFRSCLISKKLSEDDFFDWMHLQSHSSSPISRTSRNSMSPGHGKEQIQENHLAAKPKVIVLESPSNMANLGNANRILSRSVGNIESSTGDQCSPLVSENVSDYEEESNQNKASITLFPKNLKLTFLLDRLLKHPLLFFLLLRIIPILMPVQYQQFKVPQLRKLLGQPR